MFLFQYVKSNNLVQHEEQAKSIKINTFFSIHNGGLTIEAPLKARRTDFQVEQLQFMIRGDAKLKASYFNGCHSEN